jgi:glycosyltransferase involved in cell wall biosynthesis
MSRDQPRVSIALPVHDGARHLADAIESHLAQTFGDFELLICDNASADGTEEIGRDYAARDPRIHYRRRGQLVSGSENFNLAFDEARAPIFKWSAHDDLITPEFLERCMAALEERPQAVLCHSGLLRVDGDGRPIGEQPCALRDVDVPDPVARFREVLFRRHGCLPIYGLMRSEAIRRTRRFGSYLGSDRILLAELALEGPMVILPEPLFVLREHPGRATRRQRGRERSEWFDIESRRRTLWPKWRRLREYDRAIGRSPLSPDERRQCRRALAVWSWRERGGLARNLGSGLLEFAGLRSWADRGLDPRPAEDA